MNKLQAFVFHFKKGLKAIPFAQLDVAKIKQFAQQSTVTGQSVTYDEATGKVTVNIGGEEHTEQLMDLAADGALVNFAPDHTAAPATENAPATTEVTTDVATEVSADIAATTAAQNTIAQNNETKVADTAGLGPDIAAVVDAATDETAKAGDGSVDENKTTEAATATSENTPETAPATTNEPAITTNSTTTEPADLTKGGKVEGGKGEGAE